MDVEVVALLVFNADWLFSKGEAAVRNVEVACGEEGDASDCC